jgi:hypothetical protein
MAAALFGKGAKTTAQQRAISPTASDLSQRAWIPSRAIFLLLAATFAGLATRMFFLISQYAVNIFYSDQWEFNDATLFQKHSLWQMFSWQHGPHRQGLGALLEKLVDPLSGWNGRVESFVVGSVVVVAALCAILLKHRLYGRLVLSDIVIPAILFTPAQWETLVLTPNFAHGPLPLLLVMLYFLAWTLPNANVKFPLVLLVNFFTVYTGFGLLLGLVTPVLLLLDHATTDSQQRVSKAYLWLAIAVSLLSLGSFFIGWKFNPDLDCFLPQPRSPGWYTVYVALMLANFFAVRGISTAPRIVGGVVLLVLVAVALTALRQMIFESKPEGRKAPVTQRLVSFGMIVYSLLFCLATAYGRLCGGLPQSSRYVIYLEIAMLGLYFYLLSLPSGPFRKWTLALFLASTLSAVAVADRSEVFLYTLGKQQWKECYLRTEDFAGCNDTVGFTIFSHAPERTRLREKLEFLKKARLNLYLDAH